MNHGPEDICARCKHFRMKQYPEYAALGMGRCHGYDQAFTQLANPFTHWETKACAKYRRVWDERRDAWITKTRGLEQQSKADETISRASAPTAAPT